MLLIDEDYALEEEKSADVYRNCSKCTLTLQVYRGEDRMNLQTMKVNTTSWSCYNCLQSKILTLRINMVVKLPGIHSFKMNECQAIPNDLCKQGIIKIMEVHQTKYIPLMVDESKDFSNIEQLSVVTHTMYKVIF